MKKLLPTLLLIFIAGCTGNTKMSDEETGSTDSTALTAGLLSDSVPVVKNIKGTVGGGSSMNVIEVIGQDGDTTYINTPAQMVAGGVTAGDYIDIIYNQGEDNVGLVAVNVSTLTRVWTHTDALGHEQSIELCPNGTVNTWNMGAATYSSWKLEGGNLLLHAPAIIAKETGAHTDTFLIMSLSKKQLVISAHNTDIVYTSR